LLPASTGIRKRSHRWAVPLKNSDCYDENPGL
jgi:hypothetical protein